MMAGRPMAIVPVTIQAQLDVWRQTIPNRPMSASNAPSLTVPPPVLLTWETGAISIRMAGSAVIFKSGRRCSEPWKFSSFDEFSEALEIGERISRSSAENWWRILQPRSKRAS